MIEEYLKQRLLINSDGDVFTKFDELVSVIKMLIEEIKQNERSSNSIIPK